MLSFTGLKPVAAAQGLSQPCQCQKIFLDMKNRDGECLWGLETIGLSESCQRYMASTTERQFPFFFLVVIK